MSELRECRPLRWRIRLFDGPALVDVDGYEIRRFRSSKCAAILAFLALRLGRACTREELYESIWPDEPWDTVANRFRVALAALRKQLEPEGVLPGSVLDTTERGRIRLRAETVWTDTGEVDALIQQRRFSEALHLFRGELLPGYYEEWAISAREYYEAVLREAERSAGASADSIPAATIAAPPLAQVRTRPVSQLPFYLTRFFGRERELRELCRLLQGHRLVTITGPGGVGKSRLTTEALRDYPANVFFVPLADLSADERIAEKALNFLSVHVTCENPAEEHLADWLERKGLSVLVLDNAERHVEPVAALALKLLHAVPTLRIVVTSRRRLGVPGEGSLPLDPLRFPGQSTNPPDQSPAVALFVDRARSARPGFTLGPRQTDAVIAICNRLEGLPLALELAAARLGVQSVQDVAAELSVRLTGLRSAHAFIPARHRSLRAAIQGSVELLSASTRPLFGALSVFRDGWTEEAAAHVTNCPEVRDHLAGLLAASLVNAAEDQTTGRMRFSSLESIREYGAGLLSPEERDAAASRHASYFLDLAGAVDQDDVRTLTPLDAEHENLAVALAVAESRPTAEYWKGLAGATVHAFVRGRHRAAVRWIETVSDRLGDIPWPDLRSRVTYAAFLVLSETGRRVAATALAEAMERDAVRSGCRASLAHALSMRGFLSESEGRHEDSSALQLEALEIARTLDDRALLLHCLSHASGALHNLGNCLEVSPEERTSALVLAENLARELCDIVPEWSRRVPLAHLLLAASVFYQGRTSEAARHLRATVESAIRLGTHTELMYTAAFASEIALRNNEPENAARLYGAFDAIRERLGFSDQRLASFNNGWSGPFVHLLRARLDADSLSDLLERGRQIPLDQLLQTIG